MDFLESFTDRDFTPTLDNPCVSEYEDYPSEYKAQIQIEILTELIENSPARPYLSLIDNFHGEVDKLSETQYRILTGAKWLVMKCKLGNKKIIRKTLIGGEHSTKGMKDKNGKTCWEYALDEKATDLGYENSEQLRDEIHKIRDMRNQIKELKKRL